MYPDYIFTSKCKAYATNFERDKKRNVENLWFWNTTECFYPT